MGQTYRFDPPGDLTTGEITAVLKEMLATIPAETVGAIGETMPTIAGYLVLNEEPEE